jgi:dihydrofolate reductase
LFSIIVAVDESYGIGYKNKLLVHIKDDMQRFKNLTMNRKVIIGRKTFESIPNGLPGRNIILVTSHKNYQTNARNVFICNDLDKFMREMYLDNNEEIFIIGGAEIYKQTLRYVNKIYLTKIHTTFKSDTYFPKIDKNIFKLHDHVEKKYDVKHKLYFDYEDYYRITIPCI